MADEPTLTRLPFTSLLGGLPVLIPDNNLIGDFLAGDLTGVTVVSCFLCFTGEVFVETFTAWEGIFRAGDRLRILIPC